MFLFICLTVMQILQTHGAPEQDRVDHLPGLNDSITFKHYSGYLEGTFGDHLHYW